MEQEGFILTPDMAYLFFRFCKRYRIEGYKERTVVVRELVARKKAKYLRDVKPFLKGKRILRINKPNA